MECTHGFHLRRALPRLPQSIYLERAIRRRKCPNQNTAAIALLLLAAGASGWGRCCAIGGALRVRAALFVDGDQALVAVFVDGFYADYYVIDGKIGDGVFGHVAHVNFALPYGRGGIANDYGVTCEVGLW